MKESFQIQNRTTTHLPWCWLCLSCLRLFIRAPLIHPGDDKNKHNAYTDLELLMTSI